MLIAAAGSLTGYDGKYDFKEPGQAYGTGVHYVGMRVFCAVCGAACIPLVFLATKLASSSSLAASLAATLVSSFYWLQYKSFQYLIQLITSGFGRYVRADHLAVHSARPDSDALYHVVVHVHAALPHITLLCLL
jgi:hypothetical protein